MELPQKLIELPLIVESLLLASLVETLLRKVFAASRDLRLLIELVSQEVVLCIALIERRMALLLGSAVFRHFFKIYILVYQRLGLNFQMV